MSELSSALGGSAPKHRITAGGRSYPVSLVTQTVKVAFEKALYEKARAAVASVKGIVDRDHYERKIDALTDAYLDGSFSIEAELGRKALTRPGGPVLLLSILMGSPTADGKDITPLPEIEVINVVAQAPEEVAAVFRVVMKESFPAADFEAAEAQIAAGGQPGPKA